MHQLLSLLCPCIRRPPATRGTFAPNRRWPLVTGTIVSPNRNERPLIRETGWGTTEREERQRNSKRDRKREGGYMQCFMKKEDKCLIHEDNVETTGERGCRLSWRTPYVHRNEAHFTYIYVYHTNVFEADSIYKNPPQNVISHIS